MHARLLAAVISAACFLSACGFVPPAPPMPPDSGRVAINQVDPRSVLPGNSPMVVASAPIPPIPVPEAPPITHRPATDQPAVVPTSGELPAAGEKFSVAANAQVPAGQPAREPATANAGGAATAAATTEVVTVDATPTPAVAEPEIVEPPKQIWRISPQDGTVRQALVRWASDANWTFGPDQWELNFDIPIQAPAEFEVDSFREATQALSQAVAMSESPIRPCFYGNRVLRMLPFTRSCNRSPAPQS